jgi:hypothetical protein
MVRREPWDDQWEGPRAAVVEPVSIEPGVEDLSGMKDLKVIGKNFVGGGAMGVITGAMFGFSQNMMPGALKSGKDKTYSSMFRSGAALGIFMGGFYGFGKTLKLYNPYVPPGVDKDIFNEVLAASVASLPLVIYRPFWTYLPAAGLLLGFDFVSNHK